MGDQTRGHFTFCAASTARESVDAAMRPSGGATGLTMRWRNYTTPSPTSRVCVCFDLNEEAAPGQSVPVFHQEHRLARTKAVNKRGASPTRVHIVRRGALCPLSRPRPVSISVPFVCPFSRHLFGNLRSIDSIEFRDRAARTNESKGNESSS